MSVVKKIGWREIHREYGDEYKWLAMDDGGGAFIFDSEPEAESGEGYWCSCGDNFPVNELDSYFSGDWRLSLIEFTGYDDVSPEAVGVDLGAMYWELETAEVDGKAAAKKKRHVMALDDAFAVFCSDNAKHLKGAGLKMIFVEDK